MRTEDVAVLVNAHRKLLQSETPDVGDAITVCAYLTLSFCMDAEGGNLEQALKRFMELAHILPADAKRIKFNISDLG